MQEVDDGFLPIWAGYVIGEEVVAIATDVIVNWDEYVLVVNSGFQDGYNATVVK